MDNENYQQNAFLSKITATICRLGLEDPALFVLEAGRPLAFIGGQFLWIAQPALSLLVSPDSVRQAAELLEEPTTIDKLVEQLEDRTRP